MMVPAGLIERRFLFPTKDRECSERSGPTGRCHHDTDVR
jgi:hypothetical protein